MYLGKIFSFIFFFLSLSFTSFLRSQEAQESTQITQVNDLISSDTFEHIRSYVWIDGDKDAYCLDYPDNPHLSLNELNIQIYLNSFDKKEDLQITDYSVIFIISTFRDTPFNYYLFLTDSKDVYLYDYNKMIDNESDREEVLDELSEILEQVINHLFNQ